MSTSLQTDLQSQAQTFLQFSFVSDMWSGDHLTDVWNQLFKDQGKHESLYSTAAVCLLGACWGVYQWVAISSDLTQQPLLHVSQPYDFAIETFLAQGQVCAMSGVYLKLLRTIYILNDLFPIYAWTYLTCITLHF